MSNFKIHTEERRRITAHVEAINFKMTQDGSVLLGSEALTPDELLTEIDDLQAELERLRRDVYKAFGVNTREGQRRYASELRRRILARLRAKNEGFYVVFEGGT